MTTSTNIGAPVSILNADGRVVLTGHVAGYECDGWIPVRVESRGEVRVIDYKASRVVTR